MRDSRSTKSHRRAVAMACGVALLLALVGPAQACATFFVTDTDNPRGPAAAWTERAFGEAHSVFRARIVEIKQAQRANSVYVEVHYALQEVFKGKPPAAAHAIYSGPGQNCGAEFQVGHQYVIFTDMHGSSSPYSFAAEDPQGQSALGELRRMRTK